MPSVGEGKMLLGGGGGGGSFSGRNVEEQHGRAAEQGNDNDQDAFVRFNEGREMIDSILLLLFSVMILF